MTIDPTLRHALLGLVLAPLLLAGVPARAASDTPPPVPPPALHDPTLPATTPPELQQLSDDRLRQQMIRESMSRWHGHCACPYQVDARGRSCVGRTEPARRRVAPLCYATDVTGAMVASYRRHHR